MNNEISYLIMSWKKCDGKLIIEFQGPKEAQFPSKFSIFSKD